MFGGDNNNQVFPVFLENNRIPYDTNALPQLQLFGDCELADELYHVSVGCSVGPLSQVGNEITGTVAQPIKRSREAEAISRQQNYQRSSTHNFPDDQTRQSGSIQNPNPVSTGLRLSYEEDEHNSSVTSASENITAALPIISSLGDNIKVEMDRQKVEFDHYIKLQEENMLKGARELKQRHTVSFLSAIENGVRKKVHEKDVQLENMKLKSKELVERMKQVSAEVQSWHYKAKYNESVVSALRNNLKQVTAQGAMHVMEGCGDNEVDDAASYTNQKQMGIVGSSGFGNLQFMKNQVICRSCKVKEVCILLLPCRHLCLCRDCGDFINVCPVCQVMKTASVEVRMS